MVAQSLGRTGLAKRTTKGLQDALRYFQEAIDEDPNYAEAHCGLADAYTLLVNYGHAPKQEYLANAQDSVERALDLDDRLGAAWASQGLIYMHQDKNEEAKAALKKAMQFNPSYAMAYMWYANLEEDAAKRLAYYRQAFELDPRSPVAGYNVASTLIDAGHEVEAMQIFSKIVEADPFYPGAYRLVAQINQFRGRLDEAILQYKKVYGLQEDGKVASEIAALYIDLGDFINADHWLQLASQDVQDEFETRLSWLKIGSLLARGDRDGAVDMLKPMLATSPQDETALMNASLAGYYLGDFTAAIAAFEKVPFRKQPTNKWESTDTVIEAALGAAYAYAQLEQQDKAAELLRQIDAMLAEKMKGKTRIHPDTWYRKALLLAIEGDQQMALVNLQRAVDEGWSQHWRPFVEPSLAEMLQNDIFKSMMAGLQARMNLMREQLAFEESFRDSWRG
ncbi:MAG: tetratricopeptide repeat protein [Pseudomonadales bacterium]|nr:tetratricopeptide repeat protein [Pseudomonadales bacterium]